MIEHLILVASSYTLNKRIAWHYANKQINPAVMNEVREKTLHVLGEPMFAIHRLTTQSANWESIISKDSYFADLMVYQSLDAFLLELKKDQQISALDIAKMLLSMQSMTNLKLQKMIYFVYADYLINTHESLFPEKIIAYHYGPIVKEVYEKYKRHGRKIITPEDDSVNLESTKITRPMALARLSKAKQHAEVLASVQRVFTKFGNMTATQLVALTHRNNSPWSQTAQFNIITDECILQHHLIELS